MKIKYMGKLDPKTNPLPTNKLKEGAIRFNEPENVKKRYLWTNIICVIIVGIMFVPEYLNVLFRDVDAINLLNFFLYFLLGIVLFALSKLCQFYFYKEVYFYKMKGLDFIGVYTTEFTKKKNIVLNLIPDIIFGFIPYYISLITGNYFLGIAAIFVVAVSAGDLVNAYHAFVEMPPGSKTFLYQVNNYWYLSKKDNNN